MSTKTLRKRIALVAVSAMGFGLMSTVVAPSASAASVTASVTPVRVSYTDTTNTPAVLDILPYAKISWTTTKLIANADTVVLTLTTAPSAGAKVELKGNQNIGTSNGGGAFPTAADGTSHATNDGAVSTLTTNGSALTLITSDVFAAGDTASLAISVDTPGTYIGTLTTTSAHGTNDTVSFSFTTRGAVASYTFTSDVTSSNVGGAVTTTITAKDSAGNTTQSGAFDAVGVSDNSDGTWATDTTTGAVANGVITLAATAAKASLYDGVATIVYTNASTSGVTSTLTATPAGTLGALAAQTLSVTTVSSTTSTTLLSTVGLVTNLRLNPDDASATTGQTTRLYQAAATVTAFTFSITGITPGTVITPSITRTGTSTFTVDAVAGTSGTSIVRTAAGDGTLSLAVVTAGQANGDIYTLDINGSVGDVTNQRNSSVTFVTQAYELAVTSPAVLTSLAITAATTAVAGTVKDQWDNPAAGYLVTVVGTSTPSGSNKTITALVGTDGTWSATLPAAASTTTSLSINATATGPVAVTDDALLYVVNFSATGLPTATTLTTTSTGDQVYTIPLIAMANDGAVTASAGTTVYTLATATEDAGPTAEAITLVSTSTPAGALVTFTGDTGVKFANDADTVGLGFIPSDGSATLVANAGATVYAYATTPGTHTVTMTAGTLVKTLQFRTAKPLQAAARNIAISSASASVENGKIVVITGTITDAFGNVVDTSTTGAVTATVTGPGFLNGSSTSVGSLFSSSTGVFTVTLVANAAGTGNAVVTFTGLGTDGAQFGSLAGRITPASTTAGTNGFTASTSPASVTVAVIASTTKSPAELAVDALTAQIAADKVAAAAAAAADKAAAATAAAADKKALDAAIAAVLDAANNATDAATEAIDNGSAATAAAQDAIDAGDAATAAAQDATDAATAAGEAAAAAGEIAQQAADTASEAVDAANAATDAANAAAEAADAATNAALDAVDAANAASDAVAALATQMATAISGLKAQITALTNLIVKIQKKLKA